ncbi:potassium/sodium hyperpolarization-activated cyclic nucleotide-gated channel 4-like isoform X2 [Pipistrellus kuhlii]|uniref:potassium/sodium hyperpolarization-activated cyclic nucleotide-gated channel 4-like isoform X2 n=1 Tax=Pipistrellus kuhlii TaxID=59472 RepID=UPI001E27289F|nr:potassium/sodium hyperpolarization-activated cyclic nucleotide-gated channel 4-like isoform X2 [Pipistrellus kuhlii]
MLRSPLPAAAASHTASHVSFPLFFFFLTSARGGAATARPLTSPPLARLRPGGGRGGAAPAPRPPGARRGRGAAAEVGWGAPAELREPASRARNLAHPPTPELEVGAPPAQPDPPIRGLDRGPESPRRLLSPGRGPTARPRAKAAEPGLRETVKGNCKVHL